MWLDREDKEARARKALEYYIKQEDVAMPRPDGEEDGKLNALLDRGAKLVVELAEWFSESAAWMRWASERRPPDWAIPFLTPEEIAGKGPRLHLADEAPAEEPPTPPKKKKGRKKVVEYDWMKGPPLDLRVVQALIEHYDELPVINPKTGKPYGEIT